MKRREYLEEPPVNGFLSWARHLVNGERRLTQQWYSPQGRGFRFDCDSLFEAFEKYCWPMVGEAKTFSETIRLFDGWKKAMSDRTRWDSSIRGVGTHFRETAREVAWTLHISSGMTEVICKWMVQSDREFLNIWVSCGQ